MFQIYLRTLYEEIQRSKFHAILQEYRFELKHARYDFSPKNYDVNMLIFQSETYRCRLLFVYPGGTVDIYIGPISADFNSNEWVRIDYLCSFFAQMPITTWRDSKSYSPEMIMTDVLSKLYEIFSPFAEQAFKLFLDDDFKEQIANVNQYVLENLQHR